jgi:putative transposase
MRWRTQSCGTVSQGPKSWRKPSPGCLRHFDRGSQYAKLYREMLTINGLVGSMGCRHNPYDNAKAESFVKTLKVEGVYPMAVETFDDVGEHLPLLRGDPQQS